MKPVLIIGSAGEANSLIASKYIKEAGIPMIIASGEDPDILCDILDGRRAGTVFIPEKMRSKA